MIPLLISGTDVLRHLICCTNLSGRGNQVNYKRLTFYKSASDENPEPHKEPYAGFSIIQKNPASRRGTQPPLSDVYLFSGIAIHYPVMASFCLMSPAGSWKFPLVPGIVAIIIGALLFFFPGQALRLIVYLFGFIAIIIAIVLFTSAWVMARSGGGFFAVPLILGIVALIMGLVSFLDPGIIGTFFAVLFSLLAIIAGLGLFFSAVFSGQSVAIRLLAAVCGIILAAIGISILLYTEVTAQVIVQLIGLFFAGAGVIALIGALVLCRRSKQPVITVWYE
jgi:uncharacterized membrane protein HdeD (DUF308 family)